MNHLIFIFFILCISSSSFCFSKTILRSTHTPIIEFEAYVEGEEGVSYAQQIFNQIQNQTEDYKDFINLLDQAQTSFLKGHLKNSSEIFRSIIEMAYLKDWNSKIREVISYSFLRLAQIEKAQGNENMHIHSAILFDFEFTPKDKVFSPPTLEKLKSMKQRAVKGFIILRHIFPFHEIILINGKRYKNTDQVRLPFGEYRITALSSSHKLWTQHISLTDLSKSRILGISFVRGDCKNPVQSHFIQDKTILFPDFCSWPSPSEEYTKVLEVQKEMPIIHEKITSLPILKNQKWIMIGGAIALGSVFWILSPRPSTVSDSPKSNSRASATRSAGFSGPSIQIGF